MQHGFNEEARKQSNIESITAKALPELDATSEPQKIDDDWISNFFDKSKLVSDGEMQSLWAKVLAGEANRPGSYSKRTVGFLASLDKADAVVFQQLCGFGWQIGDVVPLIDDVQSEVFTSVGIDFSSLTHLNDIGLLRFEPLAGFRRIGFPKNMAVFYYGTPILIEFKNEQQNELETGKVLLSKIGQELAPICGSKQVSGFIDYVLKKWADKGLVLSSPYPRFDPNQLHPDPIPKEVAADNSRTLADGDLMAFSAAHG
jgi:hypothetical protein